MHDIRMRSVYQCQFDQLQEAVPSPIRLCNVCGCRGPLSCGKCKKAFYCGAAHQRIDWTQGNHRSHCGSDSPVVNSEVSYDCLFKEYELVTEAEVLPSTGSNETVQEAEKRRLQEYEDYLKNKSEDESLKDVPDEEFSKYTSDIKEDAVFEKFQKRVRHEKTQVDMKNGSNVNETSNNNNAVFDSRYCDLNVEHRHYGSPISIY